MKNGTNGHILNVLPSGQTQDQKNLYINLKLSSLGQPTSNEKSTKDFLQFAHPLLENAKEKNVLLEEVLSPVDQRINDFLNDYLSDVVDEKDIWLPHRTFVLDVKGLARDMSLPPDTDSFTSPMVKSYRVKQGVLHNPKHDRRTTKGSFHVVEGGFPVPDDKIAVPKTAFVHMLRSALKPSRELMILPFTATQEEKAQLWVSLLLRPTVCPEVPGFISKKMSEIRFFAPGSLVSNLDFVESIFGNGGDPYLPKNDAGLDVEHWTGHTGCVILAPQLIRLKKKDIGLPHKKDATPRQLRDGMYWTHKDDLYNEGGAFKITCRDQRGVMVTIIADNYFGYSKKEIKTQISFAANLYGLTEEEHAGGAIAYPSYVLGREFTAGTVNWSVKNKFKDILSLLKGRVDVKPEGYAVDRNFPSIIYVPENAHFSVGTNSVWWEKGAKRQKIKLLLGKTYVLPSGYKVHLEKQKGGRTWRLVGTVAVGTLCHKPCTVSGGGKSEISKAISYSMIQGPVFVNDFHADFDRLEKIFQKNFKGIFRDKSRNRQSRPVLSPDRSLGSVIKLLTPSNEYTPSHNKWIQSLPNYVRDLVIVVKRYFKPEWGSDWRKHFSVDQINGNPGHELKFDNHKLLSNYLRVGFEADGSWRIFKLRSDYHWAQKVQVEDDITASVVVPSESVNYDYDFNSGSVKFVQNCESKLFQRPDDCIIRGYDKQAEGDLATPGTFLSNFEPLERPAAKEIIENTTTFDDYSLPIKNLIREVLSSDSPQYFVCSDRPRIVNGKPTKNPRYLQSRPDLEDPQGVYLSRVGTRIAWGIPVSKPLPIVVNSVLAGRRNNPPDKKNGIPALAVYNPIHYQELPELFMDFICSLTGKSPSTTGFGTEGALTKKPFNALPPIIDLNNALLSYIMTGYGGFTTAAGYVGPQVKVDHDISLLVPEIWSRMTPLERTPEFLIDNGFLEKLNDFNYKGKKVLASRLGYRITSKFADQILGRIFNNPGRVFSREMLKPELQDPETFAVGIQNIVITMENEAENYFRDGSIKFACPPLKALLHIMKNGNYKGKKIDHPDIRNLFKRDVVVKSDWYRERLATKQEKDIRLWTRHLNYFLHRKTSLVGFSRLDIKSKEDYIRKKLKEAQAPSYLKKIHGTIGADPFSGVGSSAPTGSAKTVISQV